MEWRSKLSVKASPFSCHQNLVTIVAAKVAGKEEKGERKMVKREGKGIRRISLLVVALAIIATVVWGSIAAAQRNGSEGKYATTYIVAEAAAPEEPAVPVEATVPAEAATPAEPAPAVEETVTEPETPAATTEAPTEITVEPVATLEIEEPEEPAAFAEPVATPAPVAVVAEPMAASAELITIPAETSVVSVESVVASEMPATTPVAPTAASVEPVETTAGASFVEFYDAKLNRLYVDLEELSNADFESVPGILEQYGNGNVEVYDYESQTKIEM